MVQNRRWLIALACVAASAACSESGGERGVIGGGVRPGPGQPADRDGDESAATAGDDHAGGTLPDGGRLGPNPDAFWEDDPPPAYCGPEPAPELVPPGGTPECPDDKNREGCPCDTPGETAPCWPGLRANRNRGQCADGMTTCENIFEFNNAWGPCIGFVPPSKTATTGPGACRCFSRGSWVIDNLSPCILTDPNTNQVVSVLSSTVDGQCVQTDSPGDWSTNTLNVDCAGQFELCFTLKAGDVTNPQPGDCTLARVCTSAWYPEPDVPMALPNLGGFVANDSACGQRFVDEGGYGEMSVLGESIECDPVDDGAGGPYVFSRTGYCPLECSTDPSLPECQSCARGGSGDF